MKNSLHRGKRKDNGKWVVGNLLYDHISNIAAIVTYVNLGGGGNVDDLSEINIFEVDPKTLGQDTELTDTNDKLIFEGDIVIDINNKNSKYVVKFSAARCGFFPFARGDGCGCCEINTLMIEFAEVIGNIYDNPELIGDEAK